MKDSIYVDIRNDFSYGPFYESGVRMPLTIKDDLLIATDIDGIDTRNAGCVEDGIATKLATVTLSTKGSVTVELFESDAGEDQAVIEAINATMMELRELWADYVSDMHSDLPEEPYITVGNCFVPLKELRQNYGQPSEAPITAQLIPPTRRQELLDILVNNMCEEEGCNGRRVCEKLFSLGFTADELLALQFSRDDVEGLTRSSKE